MTVKQNVLNLLENNRGIYLSGEAIAEQLQVTRAAVWKAIDSLRKDGFVIDAHTNKGYTLSVNSDVLTQAGIEKHLRTDCALTVEVHNIVSSTNTLLRERTHEPEGLVVAANEQTAGMGRMGRSFYSPKETGVYFSILLKPPQADATFITTMAAVAVCQAIERISNKKPKIKWVNDVYVEGKKVCGILTQASFSLENKTVEYAILGIGLNVYAPPSGVFPSEIESVAGAIFEKPQGELKNRLLAEVLNCFFTLYHSPPKVVAAEYKALSFVIGREVLVIQPTHSAPATVLDIDENCNLVVSYADGSRHVLSSGEISIKV